MSRFLLTGIAVLDIVNTVAHFPAEDEEMRALSSEHVRGGNAANTACILTQAGHEVFFAGTLAKDQAGDFIHNDMQQRGIRMDYGQRMQGSTPTSYITLNQHNGSRSIVHHRDLHELSFAQFDSIPLQRFDAFHFEGRNVAHVRRMMDKVLKHRVDQTLSVEIEKDREDIDSLMTGADILLFSKSFAEARGFTTPRDFLQQLHQQHAVFLSCTWGASGAYAMTMSGEFIEAPAITVNGIDSIGAGDTYNAGLLHALSQGSTFTDAIHFARELATKKVQQRGFDGLLS